MRAPFTAVFMMMVAGGIALSAQTGDKKDVTLKGTIVCAKCGLKEKGVTKCTTAIKVKENGKDVLYYFDDKGAKEKYHEPVCGGEEKEGTVNGVVSLKDNKKWIKPSKVEFATK